MFGKAMLIWIVVLVTAVPYTAWYLLFEAPREQYALLILFIFAWPFGYWGVVGPLIAGLKVRAVFRALENAQSSAELRRTLQSEEAREVAIDLIASENGIPRFLAKRVHAAVMKRLLAEPEAPGGRSS